MQHLKSDNSNVYSALNIAQCPRRKAPLMFLTETKRLASIWGLRDLAAGIAGYDKVDLRKDFGEAENVASFI